MSSRGRRYIMTVDTAADLSPSEADGALCFVHDEQAFYKRAGNAWQPFSNSGGSIFNTLTYDTAKVTDVLDIGDVYVEVGRLQTPVRAAGKYVVGYSLTYDFPDVNDTVYLRWRVDGSPWNEFRSEPKDIKDKIARYYEFPQDYTEGAHLIEMQMKKQDVQSAELNLRYLDLFMQRVG